MSRFLAMVVMIGLVCAVGCGSGAPSRDTSMIDVSATVTGPDGKPLSKGLVIVLQPTGDTLGAKLTAKSDGAFSGQASPGRYVYYVRSAKGEDAAPASLPAEFTEPRKENSVEVAAGKQLDIKIGN